MFDKEYLKKVTAYIQNDICLLKNDAEITEIKIDTEITYILRKETERYVLSIAERGQISERAVYRDEKEMKQKIAFLLKNTFCGGIDYRNIDDFKEITNVEDLRRLMDLLVDKNDYAINEEKIDCVNMEEDKNKKYNIYYLDKYNNKYMLEKGGDIQYVFRRFYNEIVYCKTMKNRISEYEMIFGYELNYMEKIRVLGYIR